MATGNRIREAHMDRQDWKGLGDDELVANAARGDDSALEAFLARHAPMAARIAHSVLGNSGDAPDAVQDALINLAQSIAKMDSGRAARAWLCSAARGAALDQLRRRSAQARLAARAGNSNAKKEAGMADDGVERAEAVDALREELAALPEETAAALLLHYLEGLPVAAAAGELGVSEDACKQRLKRGRDALRERLARRGFGLAGGALLVTLIAEICDGARAAAAAWEPERFEALAREAASAAARPANLAKPEPSRDGVRPEAAPARGRWQASATVAVCAALLAAAALLFFAAQPDALQTPIAAAEPANAQGGGSARPVAASNEVQPEAKRADVDPVTNGALARGAQGGEEEDGPLQWQPPRFFDGFAGTHAVAARGERLALVTTTAERTLRYLLWTSQDNGRSWSNSRPLLSSSLKGAEWDAAVGEDGTAYLACTAHKEGVDGPIPPTGVYWQVMTDGADAGKVEAIEDFGKGGRPFHPRVLREGGANWVFYRTGGDITVARSTGTACPKPVTREQGGCRQKPPAWATDDQRAGFVKVRTERFDDADGSGRAVALRHWLVHAATADGGATWQTQELPIPRLDSGSEEARGLYIMPKDLARLGDKLFAMVHIAYSLTDAEPVRRTFLYASDDLGAHWKKPMEVPDGYDSLAVLEESIAGHDTPRLWMVIVCGGPNWPMDLEAGHPPVAQVSADGGKTWTPHQAFEEMGTGCNLGALCFNGTSIHVGLTTYQFVRSRKAESAVLMRSLARGAWRPAENKPDWITFPTEQPLPARSDDF